MLIEMAVEFEADPQSGAERRQAVQVDPHQVLRHRAVYGQRHRGEREGSQDHRLEYRPLLVPAEAAQLAPDGDDRPREPGQAAENAVEEPDADIGRKRALHTVDVRPDQEIAGIGDQQHTDAVANKIGPDVAEQRRADRHADDAAADERRHLPQAECMAQLPDAVALDKQPVTDDQRGSLSRRQDVQPDAGDDQPHGEAGQPADDAPNESR